MTDTTTIERRSLNAAKWLNLLMGCIGVVAALLANADALLLDGLFSGLNFLSALVAGRVAASVSRPPDASRPFGYEIDESVFVMFRGLLLSGIILMGLLTALNRLVGYWRTGEAEPVVLGWITVYAGLMVVLCFGLYLYHRWNWRRTGRTSTLLEVEAKSALVDGALSAGAGFAFLGIGLLRGGPLEVIVPVSDSIVVLILCLLMIPQPIGVFRRALREVLGMSLPAPEIAAIEKEARQVLAGTAFDLLAVAAVRIGRHPFYLAYLRPVGRVGTVEIDEVRQRLIAAAAPGRVEISLANKPPYEVAHPGAHPAQ